MQRKKFKLFAFLLPGFFSLGIQAQEAMPSSGGNATGNGGTASYSIGQVAYTANDGSNGSVSQGVQQVFIVSAISGIDQTSGINLLCQVYPNPAVESLTLHIESTELKLSDLYYQLYDFSGKNLAIKPLTERETNITMSEFAPSTYFLRVIQNKKVLKTFKIIKN